MKLELVAAHEAKLRYIGKRLADETESYLQQIANTFQPLITKINFLVQMVKASFFNENIRPDPTGMISKAIGGCVLIKNAEEINLPQQSCLAWS